MLLCGDIVNSVTNIKVYMKKYIKGAKLLGLLATIIFGTCYFIRKSDSLSENIEISVKNTLTVSKNYKSISNSNPRTLSPDEKNQLINQHPELNLKKSKDINSIFLVQHKCRLNDTLYSVLVYVSKSNFVYAVDRLRRN